MKIYLLNKLVIRWYIKVGRYPFPRNAAANPRAFNYRKAPFTATSTEG